MVSCVKILKLASVTAEAAFLFSISGLWVLFDILQSVFYQFDWDFGYFFEPFPRSFLRYFRGCVFRKLMHSHPLETNPTQHICPAILVMYYWVLLFCLSYACIISPEICFKSTTHQRVHFISTVRLRFVGTKAKWMQRKIGGDRKYRRKKTK